MRLAMPHNELLPPVRLQTKPETKGQAKIQRDSGKIEQLNFQRLVTRGTELIMTPLKKKN